MEKKKKTSEVIENRLFYSLCRVEEAVLNAIYDLLPSYYPILVLVLPSILFV